jgi:hypothetical protein
MDLQTRERQPRARTETPLLGDIFRFETYFEQIFIVLVKKIANEVLATKKNEARARAEALLVPAKKDARVGLLRQQGRRA